MSFIHTLILITLFGCSSQIFASQGYSSITQYEMKMLKINKLNKLVDDYLKIGRPLNPKEEAEASSALFEAIWEMKGGLINEGGRKYLPFILNDHDYNKLLSNTLTLDLANLSDVLITAGANANTVGRFGYGILHVISTIRFPNIETANAAVKRYLELGAEINAFDGLRSTPLHFAARLGNTESLGALLNHGADINLKSVLVGMTALDIAKNLGHSDIVKILEDHVAKQANSSSHSDHEDRPTKKRKLEKKRSLDDNFLINDKYMKDDSVKFSPFFSENLGSSHDWLKKPSVEFAKVLHGASLKSLSNQPKLYTITTPYFQAKLYSLDPKDYIKKRISFVFPGRKSEATVPREDAKEGRVILVVPSKDFEDAKVWANAYTDILFIEGLSTHGTKLSSDELGLISSRRLAALYFAGSLKLKNFIMLDDNIEKLYLSDPSVKKWSQVYAFLKNLAHDQNLKLLSVRGYKPLLDKNAPDANNPTADVGQIGGCKIFYFDSEEIFSKISGENLASLLPHSMNAWGEDVWMQYFLEEMGFDFGSASRDSILYKRVTTNKHLCATSILKADDWLSEEYENTYSKASTETKNVYERIKRLVETNIEVRKKDLEKIANLDLPILSVKASEVSKKRGAAALESTPKAILAPSNPKTTLKITLKPKKTSPVPIILGNSQDISLELAGSFIEQIEQLLGILRSNKNVLFDHQIRALEELLKSLNESKKTGYFNMAIGTGKTNVFLTMAALAMQNPKFADRNIAIVVPSKDLVRKTYADIEKWNKLFEGILSIDMNSKVVTCSSDTASGCTAKTLNLNKGTQEGGKLLVILDKSLKNYLELNRENMDLLSMILVDEIHKISKDVLGPLKAYGDSKDVLLYGFSATPGKNTFYFAQNEIFKYSRMDGEKDGFLAPLHVDYIGEEFDEKALDEFIKNAPNYFRNTVHPHGGTLLENKGIIWVPSVEKAEDLAKVLNNNGIPAKSINYKVKNSAAFINKFMGESSQVPLLIAVDMLKLGFDAKVDYEILAKKIVSVDELEQMLGRARRGGHHFDKNKEMDVDTVKASYGNKIAYLSTWKKGTLPWDGEQILGVNPDLIFDGNYIGAHYSDEQFDIDTAPNMMDEEQAMRIAYANSVQDITKLLTHPNENGEMEEIEGVHLRSTPADGNCGFHTLGITREDFIIRVLARWKKYGYHDTKFTELLKKALKNLGIHTLDLNRWAEIYKSSNVWLDIDHMKLASFLYNFSIHVYTINGYEDANSNMFIPLEGEDGIINESHDRTVVPEHINVLWTAMELNGPLVHFGELVFPGQMPHISPQEDIGSHLNMMGFGMEDEMFPGSPESSYFRSDSPYLSNLMSVLLMMGLTVPFESKF